MVGFKRKKLESSRFERELRRLECLMNFKGTSCGRRKDRES